MPKTYKVEVRKASTYGPGAKPSQCESSEKAVPSYTGPLNRVSAPKVGFSKGESAARTPND